MERSPLGSRELEILRYVTDHAPVTVGEVAEHFGKPRGLVRTTILVMMERLRLKGYLARKKGETDRAYRYSPCIQQTEVMRGLVQEFVEKTLGGSLSPFVAYLAETKELSEEEIAQLQQLVDRLQPQESDEK